MVPPASHKIARVSWYSGYLPWCICCSLQDSHLLRWRIPTPSGGTCASDGGPTTPHTLATARFGLFPVRSPLLRESRLISCRRATEMFQFTHVPRTGLCVQPAVSSHHARRVAPFGYSRLIACMQLPLNVSPVSASFVGLSRLGIPLVLCVACSHLACLLACVCVGWKCRSHEPHAWSACLLVGGGL